MKKNETTATLVKSLREAAGLSQRQLAIKSGTSRTTIFDIENGRKIKPDLADKVSAAIAETLDLSYVAGLFDRKSVISCMKWKEEYLKKGINRNPKNPFYPIRVEFHSKHKLLVDIIHKVFGVGSLTTRKNYNHPETPYHVYMAWSYSGEQVLEKLLPYIKLKRPQVELLLELRQIQNYNRHLRKNRIKECVKNPGGRTGFSKVVLNPLEPEVVNRMEEIFLEVKRLNKAL